MNIPHIEQKHNNNQTSLQHVGNLPYHTDKTATSYDNVNSLTHHNNHYTLLYPDLVQELFSFALHNSNSTQNNSLFLRKINVNNTKSSSLDSSLSPRDILFFLQIVSLYQLELSKGNSSITYPSLKLAKLLGVDVSCDSNDFGSDSSTSIASNKRATILKMTAKLESLGLLKVFRRKRKNGMDLANKLIPVLPDMLHARIKDSQSNLKVSDSSKLEHESNLEHILRTKLFVPIELDFMKSLFKNNLPSKYKLFFLNCIMSAYRNFRHNSSSIAEKYSIDLTNMFSFSSTSSALMKKNNISRSTLDRIFRYVKQQDNSFFIKVEHKYAKSDDVDSNRYDKSIFVISINPLVFPSSYIKQFEEQEEISDINHDELPSINSSTFPDTYAEFEAAWSKKQPSIIKKTAHNNKEKIIKNKYSRNIDYIDAKGEDFENHLNFKNSSISCSSLILTPEENYKEEFFEDKPCLSSSESYNNYSFLNDPCKKTLLKQHYEQAETTVRSTNQEILRQGEQQKEQHTKRIELAKPRLAPNNEQWKELRHFYPLSDKDISLLNTRANREFSNNFVNQLLLKLYIKYPEKRFKNKFTFLSYMAKILKNEKHQGPLVNHTSFRFSCNIGEIEKNLLEYEKYLNQIESSFDTSKEMQVRKKIAGRFSTNVAYKILTKVEFKTNHDNSFITALIPNNLAAILSERQIATLSEQLEAVYGMNGYYVQDVEEEMLPPETIGFNNDANGEPIETSDSSNKSSAKSEEVLENTLWYQIRKGLREELGDAIDTVWFSKAVATHCNDTKTLTLTMPTRFMCDWIRNNYSHVIRRISEGCGIKRVEYVYST